jgi:uncharacterized protein (DUF2147 family)
MLTGEVKGMVQRSSSRELIVSDTEPKKIEQSWECKVHLEALKDAYKEMVESNQKIMGILLIVVGWFVSQQNPLVMICGFHQLAHFGIAATVSGTIGLAYLFDKIFKRGAIAAEALARTGIDESLYAGYRISRGMYWIGLFGQFTLLLGIATVLYHKYIAELCQTCQSSKSAAVWLVTAIAMPAIAAEPLEGRWLAKEREVVTIIELKLREDRLEGTVVSITEKGLPVDPVCTKCDGDLKDAHVVGATFIRGLRKEGDKWVGGTVVDIRPENPTRAGKQGFVANCEIQLVDGKARIFGWPLFFRIAGKADTWERVPAEPVPVK